MERTAARPGPLERRRPVGVAQPNTARPCDRQCLLRPPRDRRPLGLGDQRHDPHRQVIRLRHVAGEEPHPAVAQRQQESRIPGETIQLRDHQRRPGDPRHMERLCQFGPVGIPTAFHFGKGRGDRRSPLCRKAGDRPALRIQSKP